MEICRRKDGIEISELDPFLAELLRQIPASAVTEDSVAAQERLFSLPAAPVHQELCGEWRLYVEPELRRLFQSATATVASDLQQLGENNREAAGTTLVIPAEHADAWLNALNQARLVIAAKNEFSDGELGDNYHSPIGSRRDLSLFQVNFYGFLQEFILRELIGCRGSASP